MIPFLRPNPVSLSTLGVELSAIEESRVFSNFGMANTRFESALCAEMFDGIGACTTVGNATLGLMLAIQAVLKDIGTPVARLMQAERRTTPRFALMPSFTFAAAAQAALWNGLVPLLCDSRRSDWSADPAEEDRLIDRYGDQIAVIMPYATFGTHIDLDRYVDIQRRTGIPVVVDAAASLGSTGPDGKQFGMGCPLPIVYSMHATKTFATAEGGVIYSANETFVERTRLLMNFGFEYPRNASLLGLNAKLSEVHAALASAKLTHFEDIMIRREELAVHYRRLLSGWSFQYERGLRSGCSFLSVLLPEHARRGRGEIIRLMGQRQIGIASYFSPHLAQQTLFADCPRSDLAVADDISARVVSLPIWDGMASDEVTIVCDALLHLVG